MRGLQHNVIEIKDTENTNIDKILVFLKPHRQQIDVKTTRKEAQEILQKVKIRDKAPSFKFDLRLIAMVLSLIVSAFTLLVVIF